MDSEATFMNAYKDVYPAYNEGVNKEIDQFVEKDIQLHITIYKKIKALSTSGQNVRTLIAGDDIEVIDENFANIDMRKFVKWFNKCSSYLHMLSLSKLNNDLVEKSTSMHYYIKLKER